MYCVPISYPALLVMSSKILFLPLSSSKQSAHTKCLFNIIESFELGVGMPDPDSLHKFFLSL